MLATALPYSNAITPQQPAEQRKHQPGRQCPCSLCSFFLSSFFPGPPLQRPDVPGTAHTFGPTVSSARSTSAFCTTHPLTAAGSVPTFLTPVSGKVPFPLKGSFIWASHVTQGHGKEPCGLRPQAPHLSQAALPSTSVPPYTQRTCLMPVSSHRPYNHSPESVVLLRFLSV